MTKLFTYGSLRRGYHNHGLLRGSTFIGEYHTGPGYTKLEGPGFPFLVVDETGDGCYGELYEVTDLTLEMIDRLEGTPDVYVRTLITIHNAFDTVKAYSYLMPIERLI